MNMKEKEITESGAVHCYKVVIEIEKDAFAD